MALNLRGNEWRTPVQAHALSSLLNWLCTFISARRYWNKKALPLTLIAVPHGLCSCVHPYFYEYGVDTREREFPPCDKAINTMNFFLVPRALSGFGELMRSKLFVKNQETCHEHHLPRDCDKPKAIM